MKPDPKGMSATEDWATDVTEQRRLAMSEIRGKDTSPTTQSAGASPAGAPVQAPWGGNTRRSQYGVPKCRTVVVVVGACFRHRNGRSLFSWRKTGAVFWKKKINRNVEPAREVRGRTKEVRV